MVHRLTIEINPGQKKPTLRRSVRAESEAEITSRIKEAAIAQVRGLVDLYSELLGYDFNVHSCDRMDVLVALQSAIDAFSKNLPNN